MAMVMAIRLMAMVTVMAIRLTATAMGPVTAIRLMAMATGPVTGIRLMAMAMAPVTAIRPTGLTELPIAPLSDAISTPRLPVSIVIAIRTNAERFRALGQRGRSILCRAGSVSEATNSDARTRAALFFSKTYAALCGLISFFLAVAAGQKRSSNFFFLGGGRGSKAVIEQNQFA